jgi:RNA polymerase sigma factor (sigma-70 family)
MSVDKSSVGGADREPYGRVSPAHAPEAAPLAPPRYTPSTELRAILDPGDARAREAAWDDFVARHSRLFLHMARLVMPDRDGTMDAYAYLLEELRRDDFRALRAYTPDNRSRLTTWLAVIARRTSVDFYRRRYGRLRGEGRARHVQAARAARRSLVLLPTWTTPPYDIPDPASENPEGTLRVAELRNALDDERSKLPPVDRLLLQLRFDEDLSASAIASILGLPSPFHVYRRLKTVCDELRRRLTGRGIEESAP